MGDGSNQASGVFPLIIQEPRAVRVFVTVTETHGIDRIMDVVSVQGFVDREDCLETGVIIKKGEPARYLNDMVSTFQINRFLQSQMEAFMADPASGILGVKPLDAQKNPRHIIGSPKGEAQSAHVEKGFRFISMGDIEGMKKIL